MKNAIVGAVLALAAFSCTPQCESVTAAVQTVCHRADAGVIAADAPFVVEGQTSVRGATCSVMVDGGNIALVVNGELCANGGGAGFAEAPAAPVFIKCAVPALAAGSYVLTSGSPAVTFSLPITIPESADAGVPNCL